MKLRNTLINLCLVAVCAFSAMGALALYRFSASFPYRPLVNQQAPEASIIADKVASLTSGSTPELVLFLSTRCIHCQNGLPLYRDILQSGAVKSHRIQVTAVFARPDTMEVIHNYLAENKLEITHIVPNQALSDFGVRGTPTVLAIKNRKIVASWFGESRDSQEVLKTIEGLG